MIQNKKELDDFHSSKDPWQYEENKEDAKRIEILLSELPEKKYKKVLDIGCGQGFVTKFLPGEQIFGVDISETAISYAIENIKNENIQFRQSSIYDLDKLFLEKFDLIVITGVLYPQYIGNSSSLIYLLIDNLLEDGGCLVSVHINEWYKSQFPYLKIKQLYYPYRQFNHNFEIYIK